MALAQSHAVEQEVDIDAVHRVEDEEIMRITRALAASARSAATHELISRCIRDKKINEWEENTKNETIITNEDGVGLWNSLHEFYKPP